ncbi:OmpA/MotB family protein [Amnibacterium endophyticum]|uniref:Flagellar motor protein MotB n=1 Tax=Amnibacterium endophyticum TaxID=2109337 RepID=A0ABW4LCY9_9MICO
MSGRRKKHAHEEHHVDERWLVSYADMITVLMALFIVLYAMSTVDQKKFDELKNSLATGFGVTKTAKLDENKAIVPKQFVSKDGAGFSNSTIALMQVSKEITDELKAAGLGAKVKVQTGTNSITISLVGSSTYFEGNDADLSRNALSVLKKLSPTLEKHAGEVTIEGHADPRGSAGRWGDDWNLASARANSVRAWLTSHDAVDPANVSVVSFGSEHAKKGTSQKAIEHNRRVDIVLHTVQVASVPAAETSTASSSGHGESSSGGHGKSSSGGHGESSSSDHGATSSSDHGSSSSSGHGEAASSGQGASSSGHDSAPAKDASHVETKSSGH